MNSPNTMLSTNIKKFASLLFFSSCVASCSIFHTSKSSQQSTTQIVQQKTPQGTLETITEMTTRKTEENNPKTKVFLKPPVVAISEPVPQNFIPDEEILTKDSVRIIVKTSIGKGNHPVIFSQNEKHSEPNSERNQTCVTSTVNINASSTTFMNADYASQGQFLYPGAIYDYKEFKKGNYQELDNDRNPIKLVADNPNMVGSSWNIIEHPDMANIRDGIASIYSRFDNRQVGTENLRYQTYETNTDAELNMVLTAGASYGSSSLENTYSNTSKTNNHTITVDAIKPLFTIRCLLPFNKQFLKTNFDRSLNPVVISSVTYGIRVLANFNLKTDTKQELDHFNAKYNGVATKGSIDFNYLSKEAKTDKTINCYIVGGSGNSTVTFDKDKLEESLQSLVSGVTYGTARPISYTLTDLKGNILEVNSATDNIIMQRCVVSYPVLRGLIVKLNTGGDNKNNKSHYHIYLRPGVDGLFDGNHSDVYLERNIDEEYRNQTSTAFGMSMPSTVPLQKDFINKNGGSIHIRFYPDNNNDTWKLSSISFTLIFQDMPPEIITFPAFELSDENKEARFFFSKDFKPIGQ